MTKLLTGDELINYAKNIRSREEFQYFTQCLIQDYVQNNSEWENKSLTDYLSGLGKFVMDMDGYYKNNGEEVDINTLTWRIVADMLIAASVYGN
jgi:hypothetical protein